MSKLDWIIQHVPSEIRVIVRTEASPDLGNGERVIGIKVGECRSLIAAGEARDRARAALHMGEAGIRGIIVKDCDR